MREQLISRNEEQFIIEALQEYTPPPPSSDTTTTTYVNEDGTTQTHETGAAAAAAEAASGDYKQQQLYGYGGRSPSQRPIRVDGRSPFDYRDISITFSDRELGHVEVALGETRVFAAVSCFIVEPYPDRPTEGFLTFNTELSPMASQYICESNSGTHHFSRKSDMSVELSRVIERSLRGSRAIDTEALCIVAGQKVWSLRVDLHVLDFSGNLIDCAHIAAITALMHFKRPDVTIDGERVIVHSAEERDPIPLSIHHIPVCITFAFFGDGDIVCVDVSLKEELIAEGVMTIAMNIYEEVCAVQKAGGVPITVDQIIKCTRVAQVKARELTSVIKAALKRDEDERKVKRTVQYKFQPAISTVRKRQQQQQQQQQRSAAMDDSDDQDPYEDDLYEEEEEDDDDDDDIEIEIGNMDTPQYTT